MPPYDYDRYSRYIASSAWERKKREVRERSRGECERCGCCPHEETAHLTYDRLYDEALDDLAGLCAACHRYIDGITDEDHAAHLISTVRLTGNVGQEMFKLGFLLGISKDVAEPFDLEIWSSRGLEMRVGGVDRTIEPSASREWGSEWRRPAWDAGKALKRDREMWPAICADCGADTMVPFEPRGKYARCPACYRGEAPSPKPSAALPQRAAAPVGDISNVPPELRKAALQRASAEDIARMLGARKTAPDD